MVHILIHVLCKVHKSLRADGLVLIAQPAPTNAIISLEIEGKIEFREELDEPNFGQYLKATKDAIHNIVSEHLFALEADATIPDAELFNAKEYDSIDEWVEDRRPFCEDPMTFDALGARMRDAARGREHKVIRNWKDHRTLLRKLDAQDRAD